MISDRLKNADDQALCVPIQWGNAGVPPVFCVPGAGASVASFIPLAAALGSATPVYGLQPRGLDGKDKPFCDVQEAAQTYLPLLKRIALHGACRLIGHSFGGWIAFEMARQLQTEAEGSWVVPLILVDSRAPCAGGVFRPERRGADVYARLVEIFEQACGRSLGLFRQNFADVPEAERGLLLARAMAGAGLISSRTDIAVIEAMVRVFEANVNTRYQPASALPGPATLVQASAPASPIRGEDRVDTFVAWREFLPRLTDARMPGNHMTMLSKRHVAALAAVAHGQAHVEREIV